MMIIRFNKMGAWMLSVMLLLMISDTSFAKRQHAMEKAYKKLEQAERVLRKARPDKGGHRAKALLFIKKAKRQVRLGIDYANRRPQGGHYKMKKQGDQEEARPRDKDPRQKAKEAIREKEKVMMKER